MLRAESVAPSPMSPFLSESAHVRSLQYPDVEPAPESPNRRISDATLTTPSPNDPKVPVLQEEASTSSETVTRHSPQPERPETNMAMKLCVKTLKGLETRIRGKSPHEKAPSRQLSEGISPASATGLNFGTGSVNNTSTWAINQREKLRAPASETVLNLSTSLLDKTSNWFKDERGKLKISRKVFGKPPWHRKESGDSVSTVSSSIREVLKGETPPASPSSSKTVPLVSPTTASQYPGGEATRIPTPPLDEDTADGRSRGFFTCGAPPSLDGILQASSPVLAPRPTRNPRCDVYRRSLTGQPREWWEQTPQRQNRRAPTTNSKAFDFDFDIPDHLPSSPLCPANNKHRSGGTGLCVYHGRSKGGGKSARQWPDDNGEL